MYLQNIEGFKNGKKENLDIQDKRREEPPSYLHQKKIWAHEEGKRA
jgi:hypothetical protein